MVKDKLKINLSHYMAKGNNLMHKPLMVERKKKRESKIS